MNVRLLQVTVAWTTPQVQDVVLLTLPQGATVADAIAASALVATYGLDLSGLVVGIFGKRASFDAMLSDGDRVELWRPLVADPKEARRRRAEKRQATRPPDGRKGGATG